MSGPWKAGFEFAQHASSPFEKGTIMSVMVLAHQIGASMAVSAADEGIPLPDTFAFQDVATLGFMELGEELLRQLPCFSHIPADADLPVRYDLEAFDWVDWDVAARDPGETADVLAWEASIRERRESAAA